MSSGASSGGSSGSRGGKDDFHSFRGAGPPVSSRGARFSWGRNAGGPPDGAKRLPRHPSTVLLSGPSGTGKNWWPGSSTGPSPRRTSRSWRSTARPCPKRCWKANYSATSGGPSTGAVGTRKGRFEMADGGTVFLDEISEIPLPAPGEASPGPAGASRSSG